MIWIDNVVGKPENLEDRCLRSYLELIHGVWIVEWKNDIINRSEFRIILIRIPKNRLRSVYI